MHMMKTLHTTVSHDMMTPIINIKFFTGQMLQAALERNIQQLEKFHKMVIDSSQIIQGRVKDLLDQNLIEHNSFTPVEKRFNAEEAIRQIKEMLETQLKNDNVRVWEEFDYSIKRDFYGDVDRI